MSDIDWLLFHSLTAREIVSGLIRDGFILSSQCGSHQLHRHGRAATITAQPKQRYTRRRDVVEEKLKRWFGNYCNLRL